MDASSEQNNSLVPGDKPKSRVVQDPSWKGYLTNLGVWIGKRALTNPRGKVLVDLPSRTTAELFQTPTGDEFVLWSTAVRAGEKIDEAEEEWSRRELADFGALVTDGSFSVGADAFEGEPITVDQNLTDDKLRVRTTHAFDWEGRLSGVVTTRERYLAPTAKEALGDPKLKLSFIEPVAWRSPRVLFDYVLGVWEGRGVCVDALTSTTYQLTSRLKLSQGEDEVVTESSVLRIGDGGISRIYEASGSLDGNFIFYAEANVQTILLPGGISVSSPVRIRRGRPFTVETTFLMRPDCRKRVLRLYNRDLEWINTVFINERRVG